MANSTGTISRAAEQTAAPSRDWLKIISIFLALFGVVVAIVPAYAKLTDTIVPCVQGVGNCEVVNNSIYAYLPPTDGGFRIPVAVLGVLGYLAIAVSLLLETRVPLLAQRGKLLVFGMTLFGFLFSGYLTAIEAFVLHEWCQWCVVSAITMTVLFGISFARLWRAISFVPEDEEA